MEKPHIDKPLSFQKGEDFENYVRDRIFTNEHFTIVDRTHNYEMNVKDFIENSLNPDFLFRCKKSKKVFYTELKYRNHINAEGKYEWCNYRQLLRYKKFGLQTTTFIILGLGGLSTAPKDIALIPIEEIKYTALFPSFVNRYLIDSQTPLISDKLWEIHATLTSKK